MRDTENLLSKFGTVRVEGKGTRVVHCPSHDDTKPSLVITVTSDGVLLLHCRAGCAKGSVLEALGLRPADLYDWEPLPDSASKDAPTTHTDTALTARLAQYIDTTAAAFPHSQDATAYAHTRWGLTPAMASELGVGFDSGADTEFPFVSNRFARYPRITVPFWGFDGVPRGLQGRDISGDCRARWVSLSNPESGSWSRYGVFRPAGARPIYIITEGPGDALTLAASGYWAIAVRGAAMSSDSVAKDIAEGVADTPVYVAGDNDAAGETFTRTISDALARHQVSVRRIHLPENVKDVGEWYEDSPALFAEEFARAVEEAVIETRDTIDPAWASRLARADDKGIQTVDYAEFVAERAGGTLKWIPEVGWYTWTGKIWRHEDGIAPPMLAMTEASRALAQGFADTGQSWYLDASQVLRRTAHRTQIEQEMRNLPELRGSIQEMDSHPHLLTFRNGTVDLRTGELMAHNPAHNLTQMAKVNYVPDAPAPTWHRFLQEVHPGTGDVRNYLQTFLGYGITGENREHCFGVWYGHLGRNGKGTIVRAMKSAFGNELVMDVNFSVFEKGSGTHVEEIARMQRARIVTASEGSEGTPLDDELLKRHAGGDAIQARHLYRAAYEFVPNYTIILLSNYRPEFKTAGNAIWSRVRAVEFTQSFEGREDRHLDTKLQSEAEGIAAWAVRGAVRYYRDGLVSPDAILANTADHREKVNPLGPMLDDLFVFDADARTNRAEFYREMKEWKSNNGYPNAKYQPQWVKNRLHENGVEEKKVKGTWYFVGVRLCPEYGGPTPHLPDGVASISAKKSTAASGTTDVFGQPR